MGYQDTNCCGLALFDTFVVMRSYPTMKHFLKQWLLIWILIVPCIGQVSSYAQTASASASVLRATSTPADSAVISHALDLVRSGWAYTMPIPKSPQAAWGNRDGRTTWWVGYWSNKKTQETSAKPPVKVDGKFIGDGLGAPGWRRGGAPRTPTLIEWLCSKSGGIEPR